MEIVKVTDDIYRFKAPDCDACDYRYGCYTSYSSSCPLNAVRAIIEEMGDNHLFMKCFGVKIEINENLGRFDSSLLSKIGEGLANAIQQRSQERNRKS